MPLEELPDWVEARRQVIGGRIRDARVYANLSQVGLAERVGLDHKTIHRIEYGTSDPPLSVLLLIAAATGVPLAELVAEAP